MAIKLRSSSERKILKGEGRNSGRSLKGRVMGLLLALCMLAGIAGGVMAFYPWLSKEMQTGKTIVPAEEWERALEEEYRSSEESLYGEETDIYPDYDYYAEAGTAPHTKVIQFLWRMRYGFCLDMTEWRAPWRPLLWELLCWWFSWPASWRQSGIFR